MLETTQMGAELCQMGALEPMEVTEPRTKRFRGAMDVFFNKTVASISAAGQTTPSPVKHTATVASMSAAGQAMMMMMMMMILRCELSSQ